jgi:hypothetical protein
MVEVYKRLVRHCDHQASAINNGDVLEIVTLLGGACLKRLWSSVEFINPGRR